LLEARAVRGLRRSVGITLDGEILGAMNCNCSLTNCSVA
jgi:hypothetical protein